MTDRRPPVPDLMLERSRLGELPARSRIARRRLDAEPELRARLAALERSDGELRRRLDSAPRDARARAAGRAARGSSAPADGRPVASLAGARRPGRRGDRCGRVVLRPMHRPLASTCLPAPRRANAIRTAIPPAAPALPPPPAPSTGRACRSASAGRARRTHQGPAAGLSLFRKTANGSETLADGDVAREGDVIRIGYHAVGRRYGVIVSLDGRGGVTRHLPERGATAAPLAPSEVVLLAHAYELDDAPAWERFFFVTADAPFRSRPSRSGAAAGRRRRARRPRACPCRSRSSNRRSCSRRSDVHEPVRMAFLTLVAAAGRRTRSRRGRSSGSRSSWARTTAAPTGPTCATPWPTPSASPACSRSSAACGPRARSCSSSRRWASWRRARASCACAWARRGARGRAAAPSCSSTTRATRTSKGLLLGEDRYSYRSLRDRLDQVPADVRIAVLDACASGAITRLKGGQPQPPFLVDESSDMRGHAILTSSAATEAAQESDRIRAPSSRTTSSRACAAPRTSPATARSRSTRPTSSPSARRSGAPWTPRAARSTRPTTSTSRAPATW